jgi:hypothetical protein
MIIKIDIYKKDNKYNFGGTNIFFMSKLSFLIHEILFVLTIKQVFFLLEQSSLNIKQHQYEKINLEILN